MMGSPPAAVGGLAGPCFAERIGRAFGPASQLPPLGPLPPVTSKGRSGTPARSDTTVILHPGRARCQCEGVPAVNPCLPVVLAVFVSPAVNLPTEVWQVAP